MDSYNYPDSGNSSPRSREVDPSDSPAFFDDAAAAANYKLKFMVSYGGKIQPRPHDNQLTYVGGETKLLTIDRHLSFPTFLSRLSSLSSDVHVPISSFKYQLPGEDLDSLISVSSEDDLLHIILEYDRLLRSSPLSKPPRMRLFLFPSTSSSSTQQPPAQSFIDGLNSAPAAPQDTLKADTRGEGGGPNSVDFLLGFEKGVVGAAFRQDPIRSEQAVALDRGLDPGEVQRQLQLELQRMQLRGEGQDSVVYGRKVEEALNASGGVGGYGVPTDYYAPKIMEKSSLQAPPPQQAMPTPAGATPGYWQEKQMPSVGFPATGVPEQQPMYVIPGHPAGGIYHPHPQAQMVRQVGSGSGHGYYAVPQWFPPEVYREHQQQQQQLQQQHQQQQHQHQHQQHQHQHQHQQQLQQQQQHQQQQQQQQQLQQQHQQQQHQQQQHQQQQHQQQQHQQQQLQQQQHQQQQLQQQQHQQQLQQQMYGILPQQALSVGQPQAVTAQAQFPKVASGEAMGLVRTSGTGGGVVDPVNYAQVMYAAATANGGMVVPSSYQGMVAVSSGDMRLGGSGSSTGSLNQEGKGH